MPRESNVVSGRHCFPAIMFGGDALFAPSSYFTEGETTNKTTKFLNVSAPIACKSTRAVKQQCALPLFHHGEEEQGGEEGVGGIVLLLFLLPSFFLHPCSWIW